MKAGVFWFTASTGLAILIGCAGVAGPLGGKTGGLNGGSTSNSSGGTAGSTTGTTTGSTTGGGGTTVNVTMVDMTFNPQVVSAHAGDTVLWTNQSILPHTVTSDTGQAGLSSSTITSGNSFSWPVPVDAPIGTHYFYHCSFHGAAGDGMSLGSGMSGEITIN